MRGRNDFYEVLWLDARLGEVRQAQTLESEEHRFHRLAQNKSAGAGFDWWSGRRAVAATVFVSAESVVSNVTQLTFRSLRRLRGMTVDRL